MNLSRLTRYKYLKLMRIADSNQRIAGGLSIGMAVSFSPLIGLHMVISFAIAHIFRFNTIAALTGTLLGNPWTFPFIWFASAELGSFLFEILGFPASVQLPKEISLTVIWTMIKTEPLRLFLPWFLGGHILAILSYPLFFMMNLHIVRAFRRARRKAILLKRRRKKEL